MYSNYCRHSLLCTKYCACVRVCVCNELSMSINMVQWPLHKHKKTKKNEKGQQTCHKNSHRFSVFSKSVFKQTQTLSAEGFHSWFPAVVQTGVCNVVLISFLYLRNNPRRTLTHKQHCPSDYWSVIYHTEIYPPPHPTPHQWSVSKQHGFLVGPIRRRSTLILAPLQQQISVIV